jgi:hypothetical protein
MMVAVALLAILLSVILGLERRRERLLEISLEHVGPAAMDGTLVMTPDGPAYVTTTASGRWHEAMRQKYDYHGRHPWLPVPPDPPEPR